MPVSTISEDDTTPMEPDSSSATQTRICPSISASCKSSDFIEFQQHMPARGHSDQDVEEPFEVTLARGLGMARKRLPIQTALEKHKHRPLSLAKGRGQKLAAALQREYRRRSARIKGDERTLQILNEKYNKFQHFVTPIHRLPVEILMEIFHVIFDNHPSPIVLVPVCRVTSGVASQMLNLTVSTDQDHGLGGPSVDRYSATVMATGDASQWTSLTVHSLPRGGQLDDSALHGTLPMDIPPVIRLEEMRITSEVKSSPLVDCLLANIAATAMEGLTIMEPNSSCAFQFLLRVPSTRTFHYLTTLRAAPRK